MIMPSKDLCEEESLLGISAKLLKLIGEARNLSVLWEFAKKEKVVGSFERFVLALDLLYLLGLVDLCENEVTRLEI